ELLEDVVRDGPLDRQGRVRGDLVGLGALQLGEPLLEFGELLLDVLDLPLLLLRGGRGGVVGPGGGDGDDGGGQPGEERPAESSQQRASHWWVSRAGTEVSPAGPGCEGGRRRRNTRERLPRPP